MSKGKNNPLWGLISLLQAKGKRGKKVKKYTKSIYNCKQVLYNKDIKEVNISG